ncbi:hypothetical protein BG003_011816 [Podila horticola]|nr:hypothetical protein BG003_011816 [Podila horticola]
MSKPTRNARRPKAMSLSPLRTPFTAPSWVLPPISPFADLGIKVDPRRSSGGASSSTPDARTTLSNKVKKDNRDSNIKSNANSSNNHPPKTLPDHLPNIFDLIQDNEDESFILWDTPSQPSRILSNASSQYQSSTISTTTVQASNMPSSVSVSTLASDSTAKRWSGGDSKGKDKSKDASEPIGSTPTSPPENRVIMAATIEKLIERLTSDIDYTFLTDFFLVYRLFITPISLLKLLMARFQWALANDSSQKHIVRIRTFVTLRHWILSFYEYDFVTSKGVLHKALNRYLKSLHQHPVVAMSTLDQRIVRDLRRHLHAQKKLSRARPHHQGFIGCQCEQVHSDHSGANNQSSSGEGETVGHTCTPSKENDNISDVASADESEGEGLSEGEEGSIGTTRISSEGDVPSEQRTSANPKKTKAVVTPETAHPSPNPSSVKYGLPSPAGSTSWFSKGKRGRTSAIQRSNSTNDYFGPAVFSHTNHEDRNRNQSADSSQTSVDHSSSTRPNRRSRTHRSSSQLMSPLDSGRRLPLPTPDSLRSVEPYMNPPPRSIAGSEKGSIWSQYLSSTIEQLSKVKRVFMSKSSQRNSRFLDSGSSIVLAGAAATDTYRRKNSSKSVKSPRLWHRSRTGGIEDLKSVANGNFADPVVYSSPAPSRTSSSAQLPDTPQEECHHVVTPSQEILTEMTRSRRLGGKGGRASDASTATTNPPIVKRRLSRSLTTEEKESRTSWLSFSSTPASMFASIFTPGVDSKSAKSIRSRIAQGRSCSLDSSASTTLASQSPFLQTQPSLSFLNKSKRTKPSPLSHSTTSRRSMDEVIAVHNVLKPQRSLRSLRKKNTREILAESPWTMSKNVGVSGPQTEKSLHWVQEPSYQSPPSAKVQSPLEEGTALTREKVTSPLELDPHPEDLASAHVVEQEKTSNGLPAQADNRTSTHTPACSTPATTAKKMTRRVISHVHSHSQPQVITPLELQTKCATSSDAATPTAKFTRPLLGKQLRSNSDPHLLTMAAFAATTSPTDRDILALAVSNARRHLTPSRPHPILTIRQFRTESRQHSRQHSPVNSRFFQDQDVEVDAYGVPIPIPVLPPPFVSMVLMYRSEMIAQQLCLIERDLLLKVQWYELVDAGWTKKKQQEQQQQEQDPEPQEVEEEVVEEEEVKKEQGNEQGNEQENEDEQERRSVEDVDQATNIMSDQKPKAENHRALLESCPGGVEDVKVVPRTKRHSCELRERRSSRVHTPIPKEVDENSPNIKQLVDRFNMTCEWVTAEILRSTDDDLRVKVVEKFIRIAHTCYNHSNFSSLTQIMLGLQHHTVSRLSRTWERVQPEESKVMQELTDFTAPFHNFKHIRNAMKAVADEWGGPGGAIMGDSQPLATGQYPTLATGLAVPTLPLETVSTGRRFGHGTSGSGSGTGVGFIPKRQDSSCAGQEETLVGWSYPPQPSSTTTGTTTTTATTATTTASSSGFLDERAHTQQQQQGGSIPFLDLVYNTELPSYVEPRAPPKDQETAQALSEAMASTILQHLPTPQSSLGSLKAHREEAEQLPSFATTLSTDDPAATTTIEPSTEDTPTNKIMLVNMHKHRTTATIIKRILTFQALAGRYPFQREPDVFDWLKAMERAEDPDDFDRMSALCEERIRP